VKEAKDTGRVREIAAKANELMMPVNLFLV
jgi:hypothetical protein